MIALKSGFSFSQALGTSLSKFLVKLVANASLNVRGHAPSGIHTSVRTAKRMAYLLASKNIALAGKNGVKIPQTGIRLGQIASFQAVSSRW